MAQGVMCETEEIFMEISSSGDDEMVPDVPQTIDEFSSQNCILSKTNAEVVGSVAIFDAFEY